MTSGSGRNRAGAETVMGNDYHITRAADWADSDAQPITAAEWLNLVKSDDTLTITGIQGAYFAVWHGDSRHEEPWLDWENGRIFTKNADAPLLEKMVALARQLNARVQGDDGEIYLGDGRVLAPSSPKDAPEDGPEDGLEDESGAGFTSAIKRLFGK